MSGFAAIVHTGEGPITEGEIEAVAARLAPRGGDEEGCHHSHDAVLLHALFAVTREDVGRPQPLTLDGTTWVCGDIRLDGRQDLVSLLIQNGRKPRLDRPDAELILHAYAVWGEACVERLIGDFGFVLWDERRRQLLAARDQFGTIPVHYAYAAGRLIVANAVLAILAHPAVEATIRDGAIADYLIATVSLDPARGFYEEVMRLAPAHRLIWAGGRVAIDRYWSPPAPSEPRPTPSAAEVVERFSEVFAMAVSDRMRTDKIAITLSGGVDSTLVAAFAARDGSAQLNAYSYGLDWLAPDDEREFAGLAARRLGLPFHSLSLDDWLLNPGGGRWRIQAEPRVSQQTSGGHYVCERIEAEGARVAFNGMGGDVLAGAAVSRWGDLLLGGQWPRLARDWLAFRRHFGIRPPVRASLKRALMARQLNAHPPVSLDWIAPDFRAEHRMVERAADLMASALRDDPRLSMIEEPYWSDVLTGLGPEGSGSRLKPLHPFFDVRLMSEALRLPVAPWLYRKAILRAVGRPFLPEEVVARRKTPIHASAYARLSGEKDRTARQKLRQPGEIDRYVIRTALLNHSEAVDTASLNSYSDAIPKAADIAAWLAWHRETFNRQGPS